ncbi:hypothetical protein B4N89_41095 [Embleya scabrispora]|uniref:Uncharacterized protein n=1 Tax=Embleya scabrispora TaxID=159449 RepID=A0A1T3NJS0_9ACTN|nr:hypothetical protein B4N89_41095 [Embleya scabrispora]
MVVAADPWSGQLTSTFILAMTLGKEPLTADRRRPVSGKRECHWAGGVMGRRHAAAMNISYEAKPARRGLRVMDWVVSMGGPLVVLPV